jgi:hypothetical protein
MVKSPAGVRLHRVPNQQVTKSHRDQGLLNNKRKKW